MSDELMLGDTRSCLQDYLQVRWNGNAIDACAKFAQVSPATVSSWSRGGNPRGVRACRLLAFLKNMGYSLKEFIRLDRRLVEAVETVAFGLVEVADVTRAMGYSSNDSDPGQGFFTAVFRGAVPNEDKLALLEHLLQRLRPRLVSAKKCFKESRLQLVQSAPIAPSQAELARVISRENTIVPVEDVPEEAQRKEQGNKTLGPASHAIERALVLASVHLASLEVQLKIIEQASPGQRKAFLEKVGYERACEVADSLLYLANS